MVSWSQGEIRHNTWYNKGKENHAASPERKRMLYLVGLAVELETAMRAIGSVYIDRGNRTSSVEALREAPVSAFGRAFWAQN